MSISSPRGTSHPRTSTPPAQEIQQIERAKQIRAEFIRKAEHQAKEGRKVADVLADGVIVGVGLIQRDKAGEAGAGENKSA
jgi:hypothetical protein